MTSAQAGGDKKQVAGAQMSDLVTCPKCGTSNLPGTRYCSVCGSTLEAVTQARQAETGAKKGLFGRLFGKR